VGVAGFEGAVFSANPKLVGNGNNIIKRRVTKGRSLLENLDINLLGTNGQGG
jgi:hypothetical protein